MRAKIRFMKKPIALVLIIIFLIPIFATWFPHGFVHVLHNELVKHHESENHGHGHEGHDHEKGNFQDVHHPIYIDSISFISDYLQVEIKNSDQQTIKKLETDPKNKLFRGSSNNTQAYQFSLLSSIHNRSPLDWRNHNLTSLPLYLSTARLRI